jgi:hypothetical protein
MRRLSAWEVHRPFPADDGVGGQIVTMVLLGTERGDVRELVGRELIEAQLAGAEHTHSGYFRARADIARNDELHRDADRLLVLSVSPTFPEPFGRLRVTARQIEPGG